MPQANQSITDVSLQWPGFEALWRTLTLQAGFNTSIVVTGTALLGVAAGVVGAFVLLRKRSLMVDALGHATLPGVAASFMFATAMGMQGRSLPILLLGAAATAVLGVLTIQAILRFSRLKEDAAIGAVLAVFFGAGVVLLSLIQSMETGTQGGLAHFIYGQTAAMQRSDATLMGVLAAVVILACALLSKELTLVCFDEGFARVTGWPVSVLDLTLMGLATLVTVAGLEAVGLILVVAMLIIPATAARFWTDRVEVMVILAGVIGGFSGYLGSCTSALLPRSPAGAVIVLTAGVVFVLSLMAAPNRGVVATLVRQGRLKLRISGDHILERLYEQESGLGSGGRRPDGFLEIMCLILLGWRGYLIRDSVAGGRARLTMRGRERGRRVHRNHRLWEAYLIRHADVAPSHVDWSVDQIEHVLSAELVAELELAVQPYGRGVVSQESSQ